MDKWVLACLSLSVGNRNPGWRNAKFGCQDWQLPSYWCTVTFESAIRCLRPFVRICNFYTVFVYVTHGMAHAKNIGDQVACWEVALSDGIHKIQFEHGTTSGKRVIYVDGKEVFRKDWMFKLVGWQDFTVGKQNVKARISIDACSGFAYEYTLSIDGKSLKKFLENKNRTSKSWALKISGKETRIVFEKDTMDIWVNGEKMETAGEFSDEGTETHFEVGNHSCFIRAVSSGRRRDGIIHALYVDEKAIPDHDG